MSSQTSLLFKHEYAINDKIKVMIPTVGEILEFGEDKYYGMVVSLTSMPIDMMVELDDLGIDFTEITEYELFFITFSSLRSEDTSLIFGDLNLSEFRPAINEENGDLVLLDSTNDIMIDKGIQMEIANALRRIHGLEKNNRKPGNEEAKRYLLERARMKRKRRKKNGQTSQIESLIVAVVNTEEFKYDFSGVKDLTIYQFNESVKQIKKKIEFNNTMIGVYAGTVDTKELSQDDLNWLIHK